MEPASDKKPVLIRGKNLKPIKGLKVKRIKKVKHMPIMGLKIRPMQELRHSSEESEARESEASESGSAIISAVIILLLLVGLVTGLSSLIINESGLSTYELNRTKAFYIAEAGLEYASTVISEPAEWNAGRLSGEALSRINSLYNAGELRGVTKSVNQSDGAVTLVSTGVWRGFEKKITAVYRPGYRGEGAFNHSLVSRGKMAFYDNSRITGDISGGDLYSNSGIYTYDRFILDNCSASENQLKYIFPTIDLAAIRDYPDQNISLDNIGGNLTYISSDRTPLVLTTPLQINGGGIMLVDGDLSIDQQLYFNSNEPFILIVMGDIHIKDISQGRGLIYGYGNVQIDDVQNFKGSVFAGGLVTEESTTSSPGTLNCSDAIDVTFDNKYVDTFARYGIAVWNDNGESIFDFKLLSWTEL